MKICTILGTRPEIIRLSKILSTLDKVSDHVLIHTGQNYDPKLSNIFFEELNVRAPDHYMGVRADSFAGQVAQILERSEEILQKEKPDRLLILGDTNSSLSAYVAKRMGIPVYHMEAGNRCYDDRVPEEVNRRLIDHSSDVLMPYTHNSKENLIREGIPANRIYVIGNPILEVIQDFEPQIQASEIFSKLNVEKKKYFLVTMHRAENVDVEQRLRSFCAAFDQLQKKYNYPVLISTHPHTRAKLNEFGIINNNTDIRFFDPFGFIDFLALEKNAFCVLSDSGTVQEECCIFGVPNVTIRDVTERPETLECGSNTLSGAQEDKILSCVANVIHHPTMWQPPEEYLAKSVCMTVTKILLGYRHLFNAA
jgi:UDP-N-acetylglucosamine 2-epimerase (non-hydrolysing)